MTEKIITAIAGMVLAQAALIQPASLAAQERVIDQGWFRITRDGSVIGREQFTVVRGRLSDGNPGFIIRATAYFPPRAPAIILRPSIEISLDSVTVIAQLEEEGSSARRVIASLGSMRISYRMVSGSREQAREMAGAPRRWVVHDSLMSLFALPAGLTSGNLSVFHLGQGVVLKASVSDLGAGTTVVDGRPRELHQLELQWNGHVRRLWYDVEGRLIKIELPGTGVVAERE